MNAGFLLVILTMMDGGGMSAAFINTDSDTACQQRAKVVQSILLKGGVKIHTMKCFASGQKFVKFAHKTAKDAPRHFYTVRLGEESVLVEAASDKNSCEQTAKSGKDVFCTSSTQILVKK